MIIKNKIGHIDYFVGDRIIDTLELEWYEANKRILHKKTNAGTSVTMKFLKENQQLTEGDILSDDGAIIIVVEILPCDAIVLKPRTALEIASICYEIGNKHLPLFYFEEELLVAFENPLFNLLLSSGYDVKHEMRKLISPLKTTVAAHGSSSESLFSKILKLTNSPE